MSLEVIALNVDPRPMVVGLAIGADCLDMAIAALNFASGEYRSEAHLLTARPTIFDVVIDPEARRTTSEKYGRRADAAQRLTSLLVECEADPGGPYTALVTELAGEHYGSIMLGIGLWARRKTLVRDVGPNLDNLRSGLIHRPPMSEAEYMHYMDSRLIKYPNARIVEDM